jgi:hypothetical protein
MEDDRFERLKKFMYNLPAGPVAVEIKNELIQNLMECWYMFQGCDEGAMEAYKLERI